MDFEKDCKIKFWNGNETEQEWCRIYFWVSGADAHEDLRSYLAHKIWHGINWMGGYLIGTPFYLAFVHFERFGQDPMKRTLKNRIIIIISLILGLNLNVMTPIGAYSTIIGPGKYS